MELHKVLWAPFLFGLASLPLTTFSETGESPDEGRSKQSNIVREQNRSESMSGVCPASMVLVDGQYCPNVKHTCVRWVDPPTDPFAGLRCAEYARATCEGKKEHRRYCIDREEYAEPGQTKPLAHVNWLEAQALCEARGARLCTEHEWQFACEGEEMRPYPYGWKRDNTLCNFDRTNLGRPGEGLTDYRAPLDEYPKCLSPFGVHNIVGNVDEWTWREEEKPPNRSALRGGWWLPGRNRCRAATLGHSEIYTGPQVGFRCCRDADADASTK